jgi:hypothetical protein
VDTVELFPEELCEPPPAPAELPALLAEVSVELELFVVPPLPVTAPPFARLAMLAAHAYDHDGQNREQEDTDERDGEDTDERDGARAAAPHQGGCSCIGGEEFGRFGCRMGSH